MKPKTLDWFLLAAAIILVVFLVAGFRAALADPHPHDGGGGDGTIIDIGGTDIDIGGTIVDAGLDQNLQFDSKGYALAPPGLPGVMIARCLGSEAWTLLIGGKQKLVLNQVCMAEFYLKRGRFDLAAQALCNQPEILMEYSSEAACEIDHDFTPIIPEGDDDVSGRSDAFEEHYELAQQQEQEIEYLQQENASIVGRLDDLTALFEQEPESAYVQQEPEPKYTDEDMAYVLGLYADGETEDE